MRWMGLGKPGGMGAKEGGGGGAMLPGPWAKGWARGTQGLSGPTLTPLMGGVPTTTGGLGMDVGEGIPPAGTDPASRGLCCVGEYLLPMREERSMLLCWAKAACSAPSTDPITDPRGGGGGLPWRPLGGVLFICGCSGGLPGGAG